MELLPFIILVAVMVLLLKKSDQRRRIQLLGGHLQKFQIEKLMETLSGGYQRALGESDAERRELIWRHLETAETKLSEQLNQFSTAVGKLAAADTRISNLNPLLAQLPYAAVLFPSATFDLREALKVHAKGLSQTAANTAQRSPKAKAFTLSAELFLMQHTCHWFCNSKAVASARLAARHQTTHDQVLAAVTPETRAGMQALTA